MHRFTAVVTTGIYCRPGCPSQPREDNVMSFAYAAAAEAAGYRACLRCRPYRSPQGATAGSELVCRGVRLILSGALDGTTESGLARRLGVSERHLRRLFRQEIGVTPDGLARSSRAHFARRLLDDTDLTVTEIAYAAGFGSIRQLNRAFRGIFHATPSELRAKRRRADRLVADGGLPLRLSYTGPLDWAGLLAGLAARAVPGVEHVDADTYRRVVVVDGDPGVLELRPGGPDWLLLTAHLPHWVALLHVVGRARQIARLDAEPGERRTPGTWEPFEAGVRALLGGGSDPASACALAGRLTTRYGTPVPGLSALGLTHAFPEPEVLARVEPAGLGLTPRQASGVTAFARRVAAGEIPLAYPADRAEWVLADGPVRAAAG
ncbi:MAG TPA: helix-turn-helix domain-containing protein [Streptosporangiales bacterium]